MFRSPVLNELVETVLFARTETDGGKHPLDSDRNEFRYLFKDPGYQHAALKSWATDTNDYRTHTVYLDVPGGTWTRGKAQLKFRLRRYNDEPKWWIELKTNTDGEVEKTRRPIDPGEMDSLGLLPVAAVTYNRREYEAQHAPGMRVTVDHNVLAWQVPNHQRLSDVVKERGVPRAKLTRYILETKTHQAEPQWLRLPERWSGSKSRWSLAAMAGRPDMVGPSLTNEQAGEVAHGRQYARAS